MKHPGFPPPPPEGLTRREAVLGLVAAAFAGAALPVLAQAPPVPAAWPGALARPFAAFCDTLIPADELSPAASALGVPADMLGQAAGNTRLQQLIAFSLDWLDRETGGDFAAAAEDQRHARLETMAALPWEAPQRRFFDLMRDLAMATYYAHPEARAGFATTEPPQPGGYFEAMP